MERPIRRPTWGLIAGLALLLSSCGGGGGGGGSASVGGSTTSGSPDTPVITPNPVANTATRTHTPAATATPTRTPTSTATFTPLRSGASRNERTEASDVGSITLRLADIDITADDTTFFSVFLFDSRGVAVGGERITVDASGLSLVLDGAPAPTPDGGSSGAQSAFTQADGSVSGRISGSLLGRFGITASTDSSSRFNGLSVTLTLVVHPSFGPSPTAGEPSAGPVVAPTQAALAGGTGIPPNACNGESRAFVVTGSNPPFTVAAPGGCVNTLTVPTSGGSLIYTAGNVTGSYLIVVTDAKGLTGFAGVDIQGPPTPTPQPTPTADPCLDVQTILVQTDSPSISTQTGGTAKITAVVFDSNNLPVSNLRVLFDVQPRIGTFSPPVGTTEDSGRTESLLSVPANSVVGPLTVSASACGTTGTVNVDVVSGVTTKPVANVILDAVPTSVVNTVERKVTLSAIVLDADNAPINGIDVLFLSSIGTLNPLVSRTQTSGSQGGLATSELTIPADSLPQLYTISALAGGVTGSATISVVTIPTPTPTPTRTPTPTLTNAPSPTQTPVPCENLQTIIVQTDTANISSQAGGTARITAVAFDSNNRPVSNVNVLFDVNPRIGTFNPLVKATDESGLVQSDLRIPANSSFGTLTVSAAACGKSGTVPIEVVSGVSTKPVASVVLQADPSTVGDLTGGTVNLTALVVDADNQPINGIDVLFIAGLGKVNPLVNRTKQAGAQGGIATASLQVPANAVRQPYVLSALAGGVTGSTTITVVEGRVGPGQIGQDGVAAGEPAEITLGASPTRIQVAGTGGQELATVIGRVFDNNGNPLPSIRVYYHVVAAQSAPGAVILQPTLPTPTGTPSTTPATLCAPDDPFSISDAAGFASIQLRAGTQPGPVTVAACTDTIIHEVPSPITAQQAVLTVTSGAVDRIAVTMNGRFIDNNDGTLLTTASAIVTDAQGNTVEDGTPVYFEILTSDPNDPSRNVVISSNSTTNGLPPCDVSQFIVQTGFPISAQPGNAITCVKYPGVQQATEIVIRASVAGKTNGANGQRLTLPGTLGDLAVSFNPTTVTVTDDSDGLALVHASALDGTLAGVENVRVRFTTTVGTIDRSVLTDGDGDATATLTIPAGTASGTAILRAAAGGLQVQNISVPIVNRGGGTTPTPGGTSQPGAIQFIGAQPTTIGVRGSGLPEQSTLTFQVTDTTGAPVSGVLVHFSLARIADESITPSQDVTDENGNAQVTLTSGKRALSVQITAQVDTVSPTLTARSTAVNILGGPPSQPNFSLSQQFHNISGRVFFGLTSEIRAYVADRFGNPVPPGTAVNFTTKGGAIGNLTVSGSLGQATGTLVSQEPVPDNGIVATLATTHGERPFLDSNGNGVCDAQDELLPVSEPFYDTNCNRVHDPGEDFIDLNDDGVFNEDQGSGVPQCNDQITVFDSICSTFSGPTNVLLLSSETGPIPAGGGRDYTLIVSDNPNPILNPGVGNPIVGGSRLTVSIDGNRGRVVGLNSLTLPDASTNDRIIDGINRFQFSVIDKAPDSTTFETDGVVVTITSDVDSLPAGGNGSVTVTDLITFLAVPTPTPTNTLIPTSTPSFTPTPIPPAIFPLQTTLSGGSGAPPNACNGGSQAFVVTGGSPPFTIFAGGGCVSTLTIPNSGGSFIFTGGNAIGQYTIVITDAIGRTVSAGVDVQGPPTPTPTNTVPPTNTPRPSPTGQATPSASFITLGLVGGQFSLNGNGSATSILVASVTNDTGVVVGDGVPVEFSLVNPVPGVSVTSPGFTNDPPSCTVSFPVIAQHGDALSCLKYVLALQGTTVQIRARVQTGDGGFIEDVQTIVLPDTRPSPTPTATASPTSTETPTATPTPTPVLPAISPLQTRLFAGVSAAPFCNGQTQTFVITGGAPPFALSASGGCLSLNTVATSGDSVTFTAGDSAGTFPITVTDALGRTATANAIVQNPSSAFIRVDLTLNVRTINGDGSFTSVLSALVTDGTGATVSDGVPVEFSLVDPVAGLSVTSPGFTGAVQPCTVDFGVFAQHGDALSCIKYVQSQQGQQTMIRARVKSANGGIIEDVRAVTLPGIPVNPPANIRVDLFASVRTDNGDGTFTSVLSASVADASGTAVGTDVPVQFSLVPPVAGVSVTETGFTGEDQPCFVDFAISRQPGSAKSCIRYAQSLQGTTVTVKARVQTLTGFIEDIRDITLPDTRPTPTPVVVPAFIDLDLLLSPRNDNLDGSFTNVLTALVTDATGAVVRDNLAVEFSLVTPVAGVSITSPGLTGQQPPCIIDFSFRPQPGDAPACLKYLSSQQGTQVTIRARVQTGANSFIEAVRAFTIPDNRATPTPSRDPAFVHVDVEPGQRFDNLDGSFSSPVSAIVTDATGANVADNVTVDFSLDNPVSGISITTPAFTNQLVLCGGFSFTGEPGKAVACLKYGQLLQGSVISIRAHVQKPAGGFIEGLTTIMLPGTPPTPTPTP